MLLGLQFVAVLLWIIAIIHEAHSVDIVFNMPGELVYDTEQAVVLTTFNANPNERLVVTMNVNSLVTSQSLFTKEVPFISSGIDNINSFSFIINPSLSQCSPPPNSPPNLLCDSELSVSVTTSSGSSWSDRQTVPIVKKKAHIFIQTDRPIYRPGDVVLARFIPVDNQLRPFRSSMAMSITAPNPTYGGLPLTSWNKTKAASNGVFSRSFKLPETPPMGKWDVYASFVSGTVTSTQFSTSFYVQEYVLPTFKITIEPQSNFILPHDTDFTVVLTAAYIYGSPISGSAHVRFGLLQHDQMGPVLTTYILANRYFINGRVTIRTPIKKLIKGRRLSDIVSGNVRLFIETSVTDSANGKIRGLRNSDVIFTSSPIVLNLAKTANFYKPGLPFSAQVTSHYTNDKTAGNIEVAISATATRSDGRTIELDSLTPGAVTTCEDGNGLKRFSAPLNTIRITVVAESVYRAANGHLYTASTQKTISPQLSSYGEYIQIVSPSRDFVVGSDAPIEIYTTPSPQQKSVIYIITSGQKIILKRKVQFPPNTNNQLIHFQVTAEMSPTSQMTAHYVTETSSGLNFIVADSTTLQVERVCRGIEPETDVEMPGDLYPVPGQQLSIHITAEPQSFIGLSGVDQASLSLRNEHPTDVAEMTSHTRETTFKVLRSFTPGCKVPSASSPEKAFPEVGRTLFTSVSHTVDNFPQPECGNFQLEQPPSNGPSRKKRALFGDAPMLIHKASKYRGLSYRCCAIGSLDLSSLLDTSSCEERLEKVQKDESCRTAFMSCCKEAECIRNNPKRNRKACAPNIGARTVTTSTFGVPIMPSVVERSFELHRKNFDETWFNVDFNIGPSGRITLNNESSPRISSLPDSITAWSVSTFSLSPERGMCVADNFKFKTEHSLYIDVDFPRGKIVRGTQVSVEVTLYNYLTTSVEAVLSFSKNKNLCSHTSSNTIMTLDPASSDLIASTHVTRFIVIPLTHGDHDITIELRVRYSGISSPRIDAVTKTLHVVPEGQPKKEVIWALVDYRAGRKRNAMLQGDGRVKTIDFGINLNAIPGTEKVAINLHALGSAALQDPKIDPQDDVTNIALYLYKLQSAVLKLKLLQRTSRLNDNFIEQLTVDANSAYNGLLTFVREIESDTEILVYGFAYSPASMSKPDLLLTCATLRLLTDAAQLIMPDEKVLNGSLTWILSHQVTGTKGKNYFLSKPQELGTGRDKRDISAKSRCKKTKSCHKRKRRNSNSNLNKLPQFSNNLDRKIYRTAVVGIVLENVKANCIGWRDNMKRPIVPSGTLIKQSNRLEILNLNLLKNSLRSVSRTVSYQAMKNRKTASPITLTASVQLIFMLQHRLKSNALPKAILKHKETALVNGANVAWIDSSKGRDKRTLSQEQLQQIKSSDIEATSYYLYFMVSRGLPAEKFANWLLQNREENRRWVSLRDSLAATDALVKYVVANPQISRETLSIQVQSTSEGSLPLTITANQLGQTTPRDEISFPVTTKSISFTTIGSGRAWLEIDLAYNVPNADTATSQISSVSTFSLIPDTRSPVDQSEPMESLCPYDVTVNVEIASTLPTMRSVSTSAQKYQIQLDVAFKQSYDPSETEDQTYVVDFGIGSSYVPSIEDLDKLSNPIERSIDQYRITKRAIILFITGEKAINFGLSLRSSSAYPIPVIVYPAAFPERRCTSYYEPQYGLSNLVTLCSVEEGENLRENDACLCAHQQTCPKVLSKTKSKSATFSKRRIETCAENVKYAFKVKIVSKAVTTDWVIYEAIVLKIYKATGVIGQVNVNEKHTFWLKTTCGLDRRIAIKKQYLIFGRSCVQRADGIFKFLLDSQSKVEWWPTHKNGCERISNTSNQQICDILDYYEYWIELNGC